MQSLESQVISVQSLLPISTYPVLHVHVFVVKSQVRVEVHVRQFEDDGPSHVLQVVSQAIQVCELKQQYCAQVSCRYQKQALRQLVSDEEVRTQLFADREKLQLLTPLLSSIVHQVMPTKIVPMIVIPVAPDVSVIVPEKSLMQPELKQLGGFMIEATFSQIIPKTDTYASLLQPATVTLTSQYQVERVVISKVQEKVCTACLIVYKPAVVREMTALVELDLVRQVIFLKAVLGWLDVRVYTSVEVRVIVVQVIQIICELQIARQLTEICEITPDVRLHRNIAVLDPVVETDTSMIQVQSLATVVVYVDDRYLNPKARVGAPKNAVGYVIVVVVVSIPPDVVGELTVSTADPVLQSVSVVTKQGLRERTDISILHSKYVIIFKQDNCGMELEAGGCIAISKDQLQYYINQSYNKLIQQAILPTLQIPDCQIIIFFFRFFAPLSALTAKQNKLNCMQAPSQHLTLMDRQLNDGGQSSRQTNITNLVEILDQATNDFLESVSTMYEHYNAQPPFHQQQLKRIILAAVSPIPNDKFQLQTQEKKTQSKQKNLKNQQSSNTQNNEESKDGQDPQSELLPYNQFQPQNKVEEWMPMPTNFKPYIFQRPVKVRSKNNYEIETQNEASNQIKRRKGRNIKIEEFPQRPFKYWTQPEPNYTKAQQFNHLKVSQYLQLSKLIMFKCEQTWSVKKCQIETMAKELARTKPNLKTRYVSDYLSKNQSISEMIDEQISSVCASVVTTFEKIDLWKNEDF